MTSSAVASKFCGTATPSDFAVLRLTASTNFVGSCTGRSCGFAPFKMRRIDIRNEDKAATGRFVEPIRGLRRP